MSYLLNRARRRGLSFVAGAMIASGALFCAQAAQAQTLSIDDVTAAEGNTGVSVMTFRVTLSGGAVPGGFTVNYATANGTATAGSDYTAESGTLTFVGTAGEVRTINVLIIGDTTVEPNETFFVNLSGATGGVSFTDAQGLGTILNDDAAPAPVPTLTEWAMILLGLMLAGVAALTLQRRRVI